MIGYFIPLSVSGVLFILSLLLSAMHLVSGLLADELIPDHRAQQFIRCYNYILTLVFAAVAFEWLLLIASVEGGLFLQVPSWPRYLTCLLPVLFLYQQRCPIEMPATTRPQPLSYFVVLLLLPVFSHRSPLLSVFLFVFATAWLLIERTHFLISFLRGQPLQTARSALPLILHHIQQGICIASSRGWVLESNPAFYQICTTIGIKKMERIDQIENEIDRLCQEQQLSIRNMQNGLAIDCGEQVFLLRRSLFRTGRKKYSQLSLSDVTQINLASQKLAAQNQMLEQQNLVLEKVITQIEQDAMSQHRDKMCRTVHDQWSQKMAIAGLSLDQLMTKNQSGDKARVLTEIRTMLEADPAEETQNHDCSLAETIESMANMYNKIGVTVFIKGQASFKGKEEAVICAVIKEGLANAVRHAYAKNIHVTFFSEDTGAGIRIENACLDDHAAVQEGRGLFDMKQRVMESGGQLHYSKVNRFTLQAVFPKVITNS